MVNLDMDETHSDGDVFYTGAVTDTGKLNGYSRAINNNTDFHLLYNQSAGGSVKKVTGAIGNTTSIAVVSATIWIGANDHGTNLRRSTDAGVTWSNVAHNAGEAVHSVMSCDAAPTNLMCFGDTKVSYSVDSGASWTICNTQPPNVTALSSGSYPTIALAVLAGDSGGASIAMWRNPDPDNNAGSNDWSQANAGPTADCYAVHMTTVDDGIMVDTGENIWTTT